MTMKLENFFPGMIGQAAVCGEMNEVLTLEKSGKPLPLRPRFFAGGAGLGKTRFAHLIAAARESFHGSEHRYIEVPPGTTRPAFIKMMAQNASGRPATVFFDECHDLDKRLRNLLKPLLETGGECRDVTLSEECVFPMNPFQLMFLFASNEDCAAKDPALFGPTGRTTTTHFVPYSDTEKAALIRLTMAAGEENAVKIDADAVSYLVGRVWPNARAITQELGPELRQKAILAGGKVDLKFAKAFCAGELHRGMPEDRRCEVSRYPRGLLWIDIQTLRFMAADTRGKLVSEIGHACGGEPMKSTSYRLQWLASLGLIATLASGRKGLASGGAEYLRAMDAAATRAKAARKGAATKAAAVTAAS